jgi:RNA recognition motif-containing protein
LIVGKKKCHYAFSFFLKLIDNFFSFSEKLKKYFGVYGIVQDAVVMKDPVSRRSRGFGFITFSDVNAVDNALAHVPHTIDARKVNIYINLYIYIYV